MDERITNDRTSAQWPASLAAAEAAEGPGDAESAGFGHYENLPILAEWLDDGRQMRITKATAYVQAEGRRWPVPKDTIVDGASIPRAFWSLIGGPFEGKYRNASVVHDHHCDTRTQPWKDTHRAFHLAMRCSGVGKARAKILFYAVYRFGPRWELGGPEHIVGTAWSAEDFDAETFNADADAIVRNDPEIEAIEAMADVRAEGG